MRIAALAVDLVDDDDRLEAELERLLRDEARLRHRPFVGVDEQQHRIDHAQHALDLAAEVVEAGRIDDVDARAVPRDRRVLGEDRDTALTLEWVGVERALLHDLAAAEGASLLEKPIDERRLAVIDVGYDCDIPDVTALHRNFS